jgi:hypothetical protein
MSKPETKTVKLRIRRNGAVVDNGRPVLRGMTYRALPMEAAFLVESGDAEVIEGDVCDVRASGRRFEAAAMLGPGGR